jgi:hypothetical protein
VHGKQIDAIGNGEMVEAFGDGPGVRCESPNSLIFGQAGYERFRIAFSSDELFEQVVYVRRKIGFHVSCDRVLHDYSSSPDPLAAAHPGDSLLAFALSAVSLM